MPISSRTTVRSHERRSGTRLWRAGSQLGLRGRRVTYAINADGNRAPAADSVADPALPTILFTGESFAIGWGVAYEKTYPALVGAALGVQAINLAVVGFSSDQAYQRVK